MLKRILAEPQSKALLVLPYVALVQEKVQWLRTVVEGLALPSDDPELDDSTRLWRRRADEGTVRVVGFFGGGKIRATWADFDIGVCTIEKVVRQKLLLLHVSLTILSRPTHLLIPPSMIAPYLS
jgi:DNA polymerase theta